MSQTRPTTQTKAFCRTTDLVHSAGSGPGKPRQCHIYCSVPGGGQNNTTQRGNCNCYCQYLTQHNLLSWLLPPQGQSYAQGKHTVCCYNLSCVVCPGCLRQSPLPLMMHSPQMPQFHCIGQQSPSQTKKAVSEQPSYLPVFIQLFVSPYNVCVCRNRGPTWWG